MTLQLATRPAKLEAGIRLDEVHRGMFFEGIDASNNNFQGKVHQRILSGDKNHEFLDIVAYNNPQIDIDHIDRSTYLLIIEQDKIISFSPTSLNTIVRGSCYFKDYEETLNIPEASA